MAENKNRKEPLKAAAAPAVSPKGSIAPPLPAPRPNVPPMPINNMGQIKLLMVNPVMKYQRAMMVPPINEMKNPTTTVLYMPIFPTKYPESRLPTKKEIPIKAKIITIVQLRNTQ
uniref:Uncharacterized protein n=1 Tax=Coxiella burnetii TaxID=777 RepID=O85393_COXBE|nr:unknown [Coxiella burnetii]